MKATNLMFLGGFGGLAVFVLTLFMPNHTGVGMIMFGLGALFGKGYSIWESRT
jgi:uncharacterized membrane protein